MSKYEDFGDGAMTDPRGGGSNSDQAVMAQREWQSMQTNAMKYADATSGKWLDANRNHLDFSAADDANVSSAKDGSFAGLSGNSADRALRFTGAVANFAYKEALKDSIGGRIAREFMDDDDDNAVAKIGKRLNDKDAFDRKADGDKWTEKEKFIDCFGDVYSRLAAEKGARVASEIAKQLDGDRGRFEEHGGVGKGAFDDGSVGRGAFDDGSVGKGAFDDGSVGRGAFDKDGNIGDGLSGHDLSDMPYGPGGGYLDFHESHGPIGIVPDSRRGEFEPKNADRGDRAAGVDDSTKGTDNPDQICHAWERLADWSDKP
jgi:hypothetical protein